MVIRRTINRTCTDPLACSDACLAALGHNGATRRLKAANGAEAMHGHVSITHTPGAHIIEVELYETPGGRRAVEAGRPGRVIVEASLDKLAD
jgi:hypothetical protein